MANVAQPMQKSLLDWSLGGATPVRPVGQFAGLSIGAPSSIASSEIGTGSGYTRQTAIFGAAGTPASSGSASNATAMTFGPFSSSQALTGIFLADTVSSGAGTGLYYGNLTTARTPLPGDSLVVAVGALSVTMS